MSQRINMGSSHMSPSIVARYLQRFGNHERTSFAHLGMRLARTPVQRALKGEK